MSNSVATFHPPAIRNQLDEAMAVARDLAGHDAIGAVHIVAANRPTYRGLRLYRELAEALDLELSITADTVVLRPRVQPAPASEEGRRAAFGRLARRFTRARRSDRPYDLRDAAQDASRTAS
jgi:hypothetical protein